MSKGDSHALTQTLLPWYVNMTLPPDEVAAVEAHLTGCDECRADLQLERSFGRQVAGLPTQASLDTEAGWSKLRDRLTREPPARKQSAFVRLRSFLHFPLDLRWALVGQLAALLLVFGVVALSTPRKPSAYRTLGSAPVSAHGNMVAIFKPATTEASLRAVLIQNHARIVDGPTASDAYVLQAPSNQRDRALAGLRADQDVVLAEPIDAAP